jgi:hypothetical protein
MKKVYTKPELNTKAYAQFENVFTACDKGNPGSQKCHTDIFPHSSSDPSGSAAYSCNEST